MSVDRYDVVPHRILSYQHGRPDYCHECRNGDCDRTPFQAKHRVISYPVNTQSDCETDPNRGYVQISLLEKIGGFKLTQRRERGCEHHYEPQERDYQLL